MGLKIKLRVFVYLDSLSGTGWMKSRFEGMTRALTTHTHTQDTQDTSHALLPHVCYSHTTGRKQRESILGMGSLSEARKCKVGKRCLEKKAEGSLRVGIWIMYNVSRIPYPGRLSMNMPFLYHIISWGAWVKVYRAAHSLSTSSLGKTCDNMDIGTHHSAIYLNRYRYRS